MGPRFEQCPATSYTGPALRTTARDGRAMREIPQFWDRVKAAGDLDRLHGAGAGSPFGVMGICAYGPDAAEGWFTYLIGIATPAVRGGLPAGCIDVPSPAGTWAVFDAIGPLVQSVQSTWGWIHRDWLPHSDWALAGGPDLEVYGEGDMDAADYRCQIRIHVKPFPH